MKHYEEKEVLKKEKVLQKITCDNCKTNINESTNDHYYEVTTCHDDWGNDSIDSLMHYDFCSYKCLSENMEVYFETANGSEKYEIERIEK